MTSYKKHSYKKILPPFDSQQLTAICQCLAKTTGGLTGSQIGYLLQDCELEDTDPTFTKWKRLYNALAMAQNIDQAGNQVIRFITRAMSPSSYTEYPDKFNQRRNELNKILPLSGYSLSDEGKIIKVKKAQTLTEAISRATRLHDKLVHRNTHADAIIFCKAELLHDNYFHAVFEAVKSITHKIRSISGCDDDGSSLVDAVFSCKNGQIPICAINEYQTNTEQSEQRGFISLLKGLYGTVRNPLAHEPKVTWEMSEQDALDIFSLISLIHRKLDGVRRLL